MRSVGLNIMGIRLKMKYIITNIGIFFFKIYYPNIIWLFQTNLSFKYGLNILKVLEGMFFEKGINVIY